MSNLPKADIVAWIEQLRRDKEAIDQDLASLESALAVVERRSSMSPNALPLPMTTVIHSDPPIRTPSPPPRRTVPKLSPSVERLSEERVNAFAQETQGMTRIGAIEYVAERLDDFQNADMVKIVIAAGLATGKRSNVSSHIYRLIVESGRFERVGAGRFRLIDHPSRTPNADESQRGGGHAGGVQATFPADNHADIPM